MPLMQRELAEETGVSVRTIRKWTRDGLIEGRREGRVVLYSEGIVPVVRILHMIVGRGRKKLKITAIGDYAIVVRRA